jgi:signal transduction histidine kinase
LSSASLIAKYKTTEDDPKRIKHVERIKSAVSNLTSILNDFLSISRIEEGKIENLPSEFDLVEFTGEITEEMQGVIKPGQHIFYQHTGNVSRVNLDKKLLKNILFNLLSNASKYSAEGKEIYLSTRIDGGTLILTVQDQGIGIPEADKSHLFTPFFRAQNVTNIQGTGLGLNIVKKYVDIMEGNLDYISELNQGTTFTITIPKAA